MITISFFSLGFAIFVCIALVGLLLGFAYLAFCIKALLREQHLCLAASFYSLCETRAMKNATVIQRLVEVHKPKNVPSADFLKAMDEFDSDFSEFVDAVAPKKGAMPRWQKGELDKDTDDIYDPSTDPEFAGARDLV